MKRVFIYMFAILTIVCACTETEYWNENSKLKMTSKNVAYDAVKKSAMNFIKDIKPATRGKNFEIGSVYAWRSDEMPGKTRSEGTSPDNSDTTLYIVNFTDNNGYLLLSAKDPKYKVLAYIEEGNLTPTSTIDNPGLLLFLGKVGDYVKRSRLNPPMPIDTLPLSNGEIRVLIPLIRTTWHQFSPFNAQCPIVNGNHVPAGCGPIATAQIIAYHKSPASYNNYTFAWDSISVRFTPNTEIGRTGAAYLVHQIGLLENANYNPEGTGILFSDISFAFSALGYSYSTGNYSYNLCKQSIDANRPIAISGFDENTGGGHVWVIDDYYDRIEEVIVHLADGGTFIKYEVTGHFVHCNWGWTDNSNGYFESGVFDTQQKVYEEDDYAGDLQQGNHYYNYTSGLQIYYNIHPNNN